MHKSKLLPDTVVYKLVIATLLVKIYTLVIDRDTLFSRTTWASQHQNG